MDHSSSNVRCPHNQPVQMLRHLCFMMEQFIEAIHMVQNGHVSHSPEDHSPAKEGDTSSEVSIDDICIGPMAAATDNSLDSSSSENGGESSMSSTETLADLDPALEFNWFMTTSHSGVGLYSEISTTRTLHAPGTTVHYFTTLHEAKEYFRLALAVWCDMRVLYDPGLTSNVI
ncbi:hypothetical protein BDR06DRAFT_967554 [Suillus hirtellus]|nr:hypothetical protein BDR06DRAFT_967554 [Suillus hirtellus]